MGLFIIILLGLVQGAAEFLPISSSGHLVLVYKIFGVEQNTILLSVILHCATLLAVVFCYRKQLINLIKNPFCSTNLKLLCSTTCSLIVVLIFKVFIQESFLSNVYIMGFVVTAIILLVSQKLINRQNQTASVGQLSKSSAIDYNITNLNINYKQAIIIGLAQGFAAFPGVSRSGSTIATGLIAGVKKDIIADYSFLLSIPIILASLVFEVFDAVSSNVALNISMFNLIVGFCVAFFVGLFCIKLMLKFVKKQKLSLFSIYLIVLSVFLIFNLFVFKLF